MNDPFSKPPPIEDLRDMTMNDHIEALIALVEELVKAGDYIHLESDCHQDCPWVAAREDAVAYLQETSNYSTQKGGPGHEEVP